MEKIRPKSVSVISWIIIILGCSALYNVARMPAIFKMAEYQKLAEITGESLWISMLITSVIGVLLLVSGIAMLKGFNWGRLLYLWGYGISVLFNIITRGPSLIVLPSIVIYVIFLIFLTRPTAAEFFKSSAL
ncbi:MAG: hypothetical protein V2A64_06865 [Candidatus Omnitrophota bacterium]